ncbi:peptidylprolyl isomerase [Aquibium sp. A9E412]|uniref:peptidylprolyl isomerase n=1 Tax=Aquibium sp. A9E412 TaxID=2976767 RepID=UPI0025B0066A|nr:peptidylprolyl isomerase [Aquibium sp. A9E412]MDN2568403.1 peptidylprolyl isomerase [Aquibium sp. A9E412]
MHRPKLLAALALVAGLVLSAGAAAAAEPENTLVITLPSGEVEVALRPDLAPRHVAQIKALAREGAYDNVAFHRVIGGFMAQTGDVAFGDMQDGFDAARVGTGGSQRGSLPAEFSDVPFTRGVVGMARSQSPDSANSQFFIMLAPARHLDGQYTVVGEVVAGMEHVDRIAKGDAARNGIVAEPDRMLDVRVAADDQ